MRTLIISPYNGEITGIWKGEIPEGRKAPGNNYVVVEDDHELVKYDQEITPGMTEVLPAQTHYPDWSTVMIQAGLEAMSKTEIQHLADARGYIGIDKDGQTQAEMITDFLAQQ